MDFSAWSPSHTIFVLFIVVGFVVQIAVSLYRVGQLEKRMDRQGEELRHQGERLENRIDKRIDEVRSEMSEIRSELRKLNQNHIDHLTHHQHRTED